MELRIAVGRRARRVSLLGVVGGLGLGILSCGDDSTGPTPGPEQPDSAIAYAQRAYVALENVLFDELNSDPQYPRDVDFTVPYDLYRRALGFDASNQDARFGTSVTGMLVLSTDTEVNAAFDEWKTYLDTHTPFEVPAGANRMLGVPIGLGTGGEALRLPFDIVPQSIVALSQAPLLRTDPQIGRIQEILRTRALPRLVEALGLLQGVAQDPAYRFIVTPRMQGDVLETPREIDQTDVLALRAGCSLLASACRVAISYELGFAAYDSTNLVNNLRRGSGWLGLNGDGALQMATARVDLLEATDDVGRALTALEGEIDSQDDDVIKIGPSDLDHADVDSIQANLPNVRRALGNDGYTRTEDWDSDDLTPPVPLTINLGNWFRNPVSNWKLLMPPYTVSTERRADGWGGQRYESDSTTVTVVLPEANYYYANLYIDRTDDGTESSYFYGNEVLREPLRLALAPWLDSIDTSGCFAHLSGNAFVGDYYGPGSQPIRVRRSASVSLGQTCVFVPVITWDAETFPAWRDAFPDPMLGGLFPGITSPSQLFTTFGIDGSGWERRWVLDWTD